jgi:hypothetical protein
MGGGKISKVMLVASVGDALEVVLDGGAVWDERQRLFRMSTTDESVKVPRTNQLQVVGYVRGYDDNRLLLSASRCAGFDIDGRVTMPFLYYVHADVIQSAFDYTRSALIEFDSISA